MSTVPVAIAAKTGQVLAMDQREVDAVRQILFFDGVCGLCNWSVDFVLKRDAERRFQFAPLQGETAQVMLSPADVVNLSTMVLWTGGRTYRKSSAAVRILWQLGFGWRLIGVLLWLIPLPIRNLGYFLVASNRYQLFGKKDSCRLPTAEERIRFLP